MVNMWRLQPVGTLWISVVQDPFPAGQIAEMTAAVEDAFANLLYDSVLLVTE